MATNILSIGQSALNAAQVGISTTGHNIANASTAGYSRQVVVQSAAQAQNFGYGFVGQGTEVTTVNRVYNQLLARQVVNAQAASSASAAYYDQMSTIDNTLSSSASGIPSAMSDFFNSVKDLTTNPNDAPTRSALLSNAQTLVNRFQSISASLNDTRTQINNQLTASVQLVNSYATQLAKLNDTISKAVAADGHQPNDLMDQRDQIVNELSKQIKTTVIPQDNGSYNVFIGNGLPLVVGTDTFSLSAAPSPTDTSRLEVAYKGKTKDTVLGVDSLPGGEIGGLVQFRAESLDKVQNQIGQVAVAMAGAFNLQHQQGLDKNGVQGGDLFTIPTPAVNPSTNNTGSAKLQATFVDTSKVTASDYRVQYDGTNYTITRLTDNTKTTVASLPQTIDGLSIATASGTIAAGDDFLIKPTLNAATSLNLAISDVNKLAVGAPVVGASTVTTNTGSGSISAVTVPSNYASSPLPSAFTLTYNTGSPNTLTGFPATLPVTVTDSTGAVTNFAAGSPVTYTNGATISVGGVSFKITNTPNNGDQFKITPSTSNASGDNRNGLLLANLQNQTIVQNNTTFASSVGQLINFVGNKTSELKVTSESEKSVLDQSTASMQSESGVNLDEEATNLLRYQQAYQAAGKMMQIASQLFSVLLSLGQG